MVCMCMPHDTCFSFPRSSTFLCAPSFPLHSSLLPHSLLPHSLPPHSLPPHSLPPHFLPPHSPHAPFSPIRWQRSPRVLKLRTPSDQHTVHRTPPAAAALCSQPPPPEQYSTQRYQRYYTCVRTPIRAYVTPPLPSLSSGKNLLLFDGCVCKLADFGMAERLDNHERLPDNTVKGTCPFLSPEVRAP